MKSGIQDEVMMFAKHMQYKLNKNEHKPCPDMNPDDKGRSWKHCKRGWLLRRLKEEVQELEEALCNHNIEEILDEAADVGNFAMMIHDDLIRLRKHE